MKAYAQQSLNNITRDKLMVMEEEETKEKLKEYKKKRKGTKRKKVKKTKVKTKKGKKKEMMLSPPRTRRKKGKKAESPIVKKLKEIEERAESGQKSPTKVTGKKKSMGKKKTPVKEKTKKKIKKIKKSSSTKKKKSSKVKTKENKKRLNEKVKEKKKIKVSDSKKKDKEEKFLTDQKKQKSKSNIEERKPTPKISRVKRDKIANFVGNRTRSNRSEELESAQEKVESLLSILEKEIKMYSRSPERAKKSRGSKSPISKKKSSSKKKKSDEKKKSRRNRSRSKSLTPTKSSKYSGSRRKSRSRDTTPVYDEGEMEEEYYEEEEDEERMEIEEENGYPKIGDEDITPPVKKRTKTSVKPVQYESRDEYYNQDIYGRIKTENEMFYGTDIKQQEHWQDHDPYANEIYGDYDQKLEDEYREEPYPEAEAEAEGYENEDDEEWQDPYLNMTMDELKERLPAYMFKNDDEKKVYFEELNDSYFKEIQNAKKTPKKSSLIQRRVGFSSTFLIRTFKKQLSALSYDDEGHYIEEKINIVK